MFHISDANDNPPLFTEDNYTVYVQEDKDFGYVVARFSVTDADESPNASPFTFDIRAGNEDNSFRGLFFVLLFMKFPKQDLRCATATHPNFNIVQCLCLVLATKFQIWNIF